MRIIPLILALSATFGCSTLRSLHAARSHPREMTLPLEALAADMPGSLLHEVQLTIGESTFSMLGSVELYDCSIAIAAVTPIGGRLFAIRYDGNTLTYEPSALFETPIRPERILRDFFLIYGDPASLRSNGMTVGEDDIRTIITPDGERAIVAYVQSESVWDSAVAYTNISLGYTIRITPVPK